MLTIEHIVDAVSAADLDGVDLMEIKFLGNFLNLRFRQAALIILTWFTMELLSPSRSSSRDRRSYSAVIRFSFNKIPPSHIFSILKGVKEHFYTLSEYTGKNGKLPEKRHFFNCFGFVGFLDAKMQQI